jgi:hypothetical protein
MDYMEEPTGRIEPTATQLRRLEEAVGLLFAHLPSSPENTTEYQALQKLLLRGMDTVV